MLASDPILSHLVGALVETSRIDPSQVTPTVGGGTAHQSGDGLASTSGCISRVRSMNTVMVAAILFVAILCAVLR